MLVLFDQSTPKGLARALSEHTVQSRGWDRLTNGELLNAAEEERFDLLLTTDRRTRYQQNLAVRRIALVVLTGSTKWSLVQHHADSHRRRRCFRDSWQLHRGRDSVRGEVMNLVRFKFAAAMQPTANRCEHEGD